LINKIGDMFLIVAISFITYYSRGSSDISTSVYLFTQRAVDSLFFYHLTSLDVVAFFLALAAFVKSAQIFFHT
jgi:NADH:ubiquinone oxidoreductase subunit 5 (subunit L)/multisubunit Na+/H+ antiporter MnhA subunit